MLRAAILSLMAGGVVTASACHNKQPVTTVGARGATEFWCAADGECFTEEPACRVLGECIRSQHAWCSRGAMGGDRWICGVNETRCQELAVSSREQFNNACAVQPGGH